MGPIGRRIAGFTAGAVMGTALFAAPLPAEERPSGSPSVVRAELLRRWERSRTVDVAFREVTIRTSTAGTTTERAEVAQRLPDRVVTAGASVSAIIDGRVIGCVATPTEPPRCHGAGSGDAREPVDDELRRLREATGGSDPVYRSSDIGGDCFRLRLVRDTTRPTFGRRLDVCFDAETGVARREVSVVGDVTATTVRRAIRPATDADFALPASVS